MGQTPPIEVQVGLYSWDNITQKQKSIGIKKKWRGVTRNDLTGSLIDR
jgi:hypothetical protein